MNLLAELVHKCFSEDGWLSAHKGFRNEPAQESYAMDVVAWLTGQKEKPLALIEGDTGVGKTLAYLVPLFLFVRLAGQRAVVATHTINLQNQMLESDVGIANAYLENCDLLPCNVQQLIGRQAFLDPLKVEYKLKSLNDSGFVISDSIDIVNEAYRCSSRDGLIESFFIEIGGEPEYLSASEICIDSDSDNEINKGFEKQREASKTADVIITSHTMLLLNRNYAGSTIFENQELPIGAVVVDEADLLESAAEMFSSRRLHPKQMSNSLSKLFDKLSANEKKLYFQLKDSLSEFDAELRLLGSGRRKSEPVLINSIQGEVKKRLLERLSQISELCSGFKILSKKMNLNESLNLAREEFKDLCDFVAKFKQAAEGKESCCGINWSESLGIPSLQIALPYPAKRIKNYVFSDDWCSCRMMFTSATLSDGRDKGFVSIKASIQLFGEKLYSVESTHSPSHFGTVNFRLTNSSVSHPIRIISDEIVFNSNWLIHVATVVNEAAKNGNVLVLTGSFDESRSIAIRLKLDVPVHVHQPGNTVKALISEFQIYGGVLITPSAWEGVSIRSLSGKQHFTELVITRAPYSPPDKFKNLVHREFLKNAGISDSKSSSIIRAKSVLSTVRKLRQGIGRLVRHYSDVGTIWFCDPRIPVYEGVTLSKQDNGLIKAIPQRFMDSYKNALVFDTTTKSLFKGDNTTKVPCEIEEWL